MKRIWFLILSLFTYCLSISQDIHFSQFTSSPLNLNPALTGGFSGDFRFVGNHRSQWKELSVPYVTSSSSIDLNIFNRFKNKEAWRFLFADKIGIGLIFNKDIAGESELGITQIGGSFAYHKKLNPNKSHAISLGFQGIYAQRDINLNNLTFDSQYDVTEFNQDRPNNENLSLLSNNYSYLDMSTGINLLIDSEKGFKLSTGLAMFHLNKPVQSFFDNNKIILNNKMVAYTNFTFRVNNSIDMLPGAMYVKQGSRNEINAGTTFKFKFGSDSIKKNTTLRIGGWYRANDAAILLVGLDIKNLSVGFSYDINISDLKEASNGNSSFELSLIYYFSTKLKEKSHIRIPRYNAHPAFL